MADFYYELHDGAVSKWGAKYHVIYSQTGDAVQAGGYAITQHSNRIWCEQKGIVWFVKNRMDPTTEVDLKEFMWVKLKAQTVK